MKSRILLTVMTCVLLLFFTINSISAFDFDNVLSYEDGDKTAVITNAFGLGDQLGKATLTSHKNPTEIKKIGAGENKIVMYYDFRGWNNVDTLGEVYFNNLRTGEIIQKNYYFAEYILEDNIINDYELVCNNFLNGTKKDCSNILTGTHIEGKIGIWKKLKTNEIPNRNVRIGLVTDVNYEDYIDAIWTIAGKKIKKHASWTTDLNIDLVNYYSHDNLGLDSLFLNNLTNSGAVTNSSGKINSASEFEFDGGADMIAEANFGFTGNFDFSYSIWFKMESNTENADGQAIFDMGVAGAGTRYVCWIDDSGVSPDLRCDNSGAQAINLGAIADTDWHHIAFNYSSSPELGCGILDGGTTVCDNGLMNLGVGKLYIATFSNVANTGNFDGLIDEFPLWNRTLTGAEMIQLWNGGAGISHTTTFAPEITLNSPIDFFNTSNPSITFNGTVSTFTPLNVTLFIDDVGNETNTTGILDNYLFTKIISEGVHTWNYQACSSNSCANGTERTFTIDKSSPTLNITFPTETINFQEVNKNLSVNWTVNDLSLDTCILQFEGVNKTVTCNDNQTQINITNSINKTIIFYVNDSVGNVNSSSRSWDYKLFQNTIAFNGITTEGNLEVFSLNITKISSLQISKGDLIYNGVASTGTFSSNGDIIVFSKNLVIPSVNTQTNFTFYWSITLSDSSIINTSSFNQTVVNVNLDDCTLFATNLYNYTLVDEENQTQLNNVSIDINVDVLSSDRSVQVFNFSNSYTTNPARVCTNLNLTNNKYSIDSVVKYSNPDHEIEYYNILNFTLTNESIHQNITLFDLLSSDSTEFQLTFKGEDFLEVENALIFINRQYIAENNSFKTVELPKTDSDGQTVVHLVEKDVVYNILITNGTGGKVLGSFTNLIAFCEDATIGDCKINLNALTTSEEIFEYNEEIKISITEPKFNTTTRVISLDFVTFDGSTKVVRLESNKTDILGNSLVCDNSLTSSSGTLSCTVPATLGNSTVSIFIYVDGDLINQDFITLDAEDFGDDGYFIMFLFMLLLVMMFSESKSIMLIATALGLISGIGLSLIKGEVIGGFSSVILLVVVILIALWKLNKDKPN